MNGSRGPGVGETVRDTGSDRVGVVMDHHGPYLQLRPLGGGCEWDAEPAHVESLSQAELLSARVAEANARSRRGDKQWSFDRP
jgi:hypothetical protein